MPIDEKDLAQERLDVCGLRLGVYTHYKGPQYVVFAATVDEVTLEPLVHYYSIEKGTRWTRTLRNFIQMMTAGRRRFEFERLATSEELVEAAGIA